MQNFVAVLGLVLICLVESALTGGNRCSSLATGVCVSRSQGCPADYIEQAAYSNYIGCYTLDKICCTLKVSTDSTTTTTTTTTTPTTPSPTPQPQCGTSSSVVFDRILGGVPTAPCDWPFVVSIRSLLRDQTNIDLSTTGPACQGVLVDKRWVLTSAFCALAAGGSIEDTSYVDRMLVVAAEYNVSQVDIDPSTGQPQEQVIRVERMILHPNYRFRSQSEFYPFNDAVALNSNNVALIKLAEPINGKCSGVICLPTQSEANNSCQGYDDCVITGWGFSTELFEGTPMELLGARVKLSSRDACGFLAERLGLTTVRPVGSLCQSPVFQNTDSCLGDEGGAVMCFNGRSWTVRALLPFNLCTNNKYNLFVTDVHPYVTWIQNTISRN